MRPLLLALALALALATTTTLATAAPTTARQQTMFLDAIFTHARTAGPAGNQFGHQQLASGDLQNASGRLVGRFAFTCVWVKILSNDDANEHCSGWGHTGEGQINVAGPSRRSDPTHTWAITGGTSAYHGAHGTVIARDLGNSESLLTLTITPRPGTTLRTAVIPRPAANTLFRARANQLCTGAQAKLAALPPFPFSNFDPLHPDPKLLPKVGRFFTGPGDPRPILRALNEHLRALGRPPADTTAWTNLLAARTAALAVNTEQDNAALAANVQAFVKSVHDVDKTSRTVAVTSTIFGVGQCIL
jgi:hypothetical protein